MKDGEEDMGLMANEPTEVADYIATHDLDIHDLMRTMHEATDTSFVMTVVAKVENWLAGAIQAKMRADLSKNLTDRLFNPNGPLDRLAAKVDVAFAFDVIDETTFTDLKAIKDMRNAFAHSPTMLHFGSAAIGPMIERLSGWSKDVDGRDLFVARVQAAFTIFQEQIKRAALVKAVRDAVATRRKTGGELATPTA